MEKRKVFNGEMKKERRLYEADIEWNHVAA
jgi:hypothetical protein